MSWAEIKLAINSRLGKKNYKTLDNIIKEETYESVYNTMTILDNGANIRAVPRGLIWDINFGEVTSIFKNNTTIVKSALPWGVQAAPASCCEGATQLRGFLIPDSVRAIDRNAFKGCTNLTGVKLPSSLKYIYSQAFANSGLTYIFIPEDVTSIAADAFSNCPNLTHIDVAFDRNKISGAPWGAINAEVDYNVKL